MRWRVGFFTAPPKGSELRESRNPWRFLGKSRYPKNLYSRGPGPQNGHFWGVRILGYVKYCNLARICQNHFFSQNWERLYYSIPKPPFLALVPASTCSLINFWAETRKKRKQDWNFEATCYVYVITLPLNHWSHAKKLGFTKWCPFWERSEIPPPGGLFWRCWFSGVPGWVGYGLPRSLEAPTVLLVEEMFHHQSVVTTNPKVLT